MKRVEDVIPHLGKPIHWQEGRSAKLLADRWFGANDIPPAIRVLLNQIEDLADAELLEAWLERETDLQDGRATASQTDLLALLGLRRGLAVIGIEAKVDEGFGPVVREWLGDGAPGKMVRIKGLCALLGIAPDDVGDLRYQLFHRTAAVLLEAKRFRTDFAVLTIQSFCPRDTGLADATAFFNAIGYPDFGKGKLAGARRFGGVDLAVGWATDTFVSSTTSSDLS